jgi:hypothetical protein
MDMSFGALFSSLIISGLGAGLLMFGKKSSRPIFAGVGLLMCIYPYFITNPLILWPLTAALMIPLYTLRHSI